MRYPYKGFTLIELLLVLFIIGLGVSMVSVSIGRAYEKTLLSAEARRMQNTLRRARELSLVERVSVTFALDKDKRAYWLEKDGQPYGNRKTLPEGFTLTGETVVFMPKGDSSGGALSIIDRGGRRYDIAVDPVTGGASSQKTLKRQEQ